MGISRGFTGSRWGKTQRHAGKKGTIGYGQQSDIKTIGEVKAMTRAADSVSESVKAGAVGLRKRATEAGKAGAASAAKAAEAGAEEFAKQSRRARKKLAKKTELTRKELKKSSAAARKEALARVAELKKPGRKAKKAAIKAAKSAGESKRRGKKDFKAAKKDFRAALVEAKSAAKGTRKRRRWPWLLGLGAVAVGTAVVLKSRQQEPPVAPAPPKATPPAPPAKPASETKPSPASNGKAPSTSAAEKKN